MSFKMIGSTTYKGKEYQISDNKALISPASLGLVNFYGGRVKNLGVTKEKGLFLCIEGTEVIDLIRFDEDPGRVEVVPEQTYNDDKRNDNKSVVISEKVSNLPRKK